MPRLNNYEVQLITWAACWWREGQWSQLSRAELCALPVLAWVSSGSAGFLPQGVTESVWEFCECEGEITSIPEHKMCYWCKLFIMVKYRWGNHNYTSLVSTSIFSSDFSAFLKAVQNIWRLSQHSDFHCVIKHLHYKNTWNITLIFHLQYIYMIED